MRHNDAANRSAFASLTTSEPPEELPVNRVKPSAAVPQTNPAPKRANPKARPNRDDGTADPVEKSFCLSLSGILKFGIDAVTWGFESVCSIKFAVGVGVGDGVL